MEAIHERGQLIVGVSGDTLLFGARNSLSGQIEGFDIDMLKEVAKAIFGPDGESNITYKVITYADRLPNLEAGPDNGGVDIVAHTMTINCNRWLRIAFSSEYFDAGQRVLVKKGSGFASMSDLNAAKATVCAPEGSTNIDLLRRDQAPFPKLIVVGKPDVTDCLVAMQQGEPTAQPATTPCWPASLPKIRTPRSSATSSHPSRTVWGWRRTRSISCGSSTA